MKNPREKNPLLRKLDTGNIGQIIEGAAKRGARLALSELGLDDASAPRDLRDLRNLLMAWRRIRREAARTLLSFGVRIALLFIILVVALVVFFAGHRL